MSYKLFRSFFVLIFIIGLLAIQAPQPARAAGPLYVTLAGDDNNDCLSPTTPCATINGAIGKATGGDTIFVSVGTFTGSGSDVVLINKDITLLGGWNSNFTTQSGASTIDGQGLRRGITVNSGVTAIVEFFTIQNGYATSDGGGIYNSGTLTLSNSLIQGSSAWRGGGIYNGAICGVSIASLTIINSMLSDNLASGGGGIFNNGGNSVIVTNSTLSGNSADYGGGIFNGGTCGGVIIAESTFNNSTLSDNSASNNGGGIYNEGGSLKLNNSTVNNNVSNEGGGIFNFNGKVKLITSTISENTAQVVGGILQEYGELILNNSSVDSNVATKFYVTGGGGIRSGSNSILTITNSTISSNITNNLGGSGIENFGTLTLNNATITGNSGSTDSPGFRNLGTANIRNSLIAGNSGPPIIGQDCYGTINSQGYNLIQDTTGCIIIGDSIGNIYGANPLLGPLQDNGGSTLTHALLPGSPAVNAGNPAGCIDQDGNLLTTDQRGIIRPQGVACDIGAFELEVSGPVKEVTIDIQPGSQSDPVNTDSSGKIPVAILSTPDFDAPSEIDKTSLTFGGTGDEASLAFCNKGAEDVNNDGLLDQVCHFYTQKTGFQEGDFEGILKGMAVDGTSIEGSDLVKIIP